MSERKIGSLSGKAGLKKAELVLKESLGLLHGKRVLLAKMTAELFQNTDASARMDTDVSMDELEKKELELLRKFAVGHIHVCVWLLKWWMIINCEWFLSTSRFSV